MLLRTPVPSDAQKLLGRAHVTKGYCILFGGKPTAVGSALRVISTRDAPTASDFQLNLRLSYARGAFP